ncbi:MAG: PDDEXK nuclease domain-containing protein [Bacteroidota bacterium]|nr:PDDEXK nuclease domain-containing protein [Bacteroidota bacterium]
MQPQEQQYNNFLGTIKQRIRTAQYDAMKAVNKEAIQLNWDIGQIIVEKQEQHGWGKSIVEQLSKDLREEFPGQSGWSSHNLWRMRKFYLNYRHLENLAPLVQEIAWSHNIAIMEKCKDDLEREFYIRMTRKYGWTKNVLIHQIEVNSYALYLTNQTNFEQNLPEKYRNQAILAVKDEYNFDFLALADKYSERDLEQALVNNIRQFLIEMGGDFSFMGTQYRILESGDEYFIDLLLFHRRLKSLVAIELKIGEFIPEYAGKMQFYLSLLNDKVKLTDENPSIGIIICKSKKRTRVDYALRESNQAIGVSTYNLTNKLPKALEGLLPSPEKIAENIKLIDK